MVRRTGIEPSKNFVDKTSYTPAQKFLDDISVTLNPVTAARNVRGALIKRGIIVPKKGPAIDSSGRDYIDKVVSDIRLNEIMKRQDLVDPRVLVSDDYGKLIPLDRWDKLENAVKNMKVKKPK
jgi:hypothetical protein